MQDRPRPRRTSADAAFTDVGSAIICSQVTTQPAPVKAEILGMGRTQGKWPGKLSRTMDAASAAVATVERWHLSEGFKLVLPLVRFKGASGTGGDAVNQRIGCQPTGTKPPSGPSCLRRRRRGLGSMLTICYSPTANWCSVYLPSTVRVPQGGGRPSRSVPEVPLFAEVRVGTTNVLLACLSWWHGAAAFCVRPGLGDCRNGRQLGRCDGMSQFRWQQPLGGTQITMPVSSALPKVAVGWY